ncbi:MAG: GGDEF domain-containing protein [Treponema sp.]|nr:GGDEF domain-containing protein [Treponema sp.]
MINDFYRLEIDVICFSLLLWMISKVHATKNSQTIALLHLSVSYQLLFILTMDIIFHFLNGHPGTSYYTLHLVLRCFFKALTGTLAYVWWAYVLYTINKFKNYTRLLQIVCMLPSIVFIILALSSPQTKWIIDIDPQTNIYHAGTYHYFQSILTYPYYTFAALVALFSIIKTKDSPYIIQAFAFIILPATGGITLLFVPGAQIVWHCLTLSLLFVYCNQQFALISIDELTGLNNRRTFYSHIQTITSEKNGDKNTTYCLCMMDLNLFKQINDTYGHVEGDAALQEASTILKQVFKANDSFLARYGGDEFVVVTNGTPAEAEKLKHTLYTAFTNRNLHTQKPYQLSICFGYAPWTPTSNESVLQVLKQADKALYLEKHRIQDSSSPSI